ncbi:nucleotide-binding alpha-beta plait domain-containing protein, partial [Tanacetum coccineum]
MRGFPFPLDLLLTTVVKPSSLVSTVEMDDAVKLKLLRANDNNPDPRVRRKVVISHDESNIFWEFNETDEASSRNARAVENETCNKPPHVVIESTINGDSSMDNFETHHTNPMCEVHTNVSGNEDQISKPTSVESDANDVDGSSPQMKTGSYASVVVDDHVNSTTNDGGKFESKGTKRDGLDRVLEHGPWIIRNTPLILNRWTPNGSLKRDEVTKVPVWVKLHNVPVVPNSADGLCLIATQVGKQIMLDAFT